MEEFMRIGTSYYIKTMEPNMHKKLLIKIKKWSRQNIIDDHGKEYLNKIKKYKGFTIVPDHNNYQSVINGHYNRYMPLGHNSEIEYNPNKVVVTLNFLKHIFGEQLNIGLDYLGILWHHPTHILPILCLVSDERNTGKTTFLNWLKLVFEENKTNISNEDLRAQFNSDWVGKLLICVDEVLLEKRNDTERLKNLTTADNFKNEAKGKDKFDTDFFGKFILCSNNEKDFIQIDEKEIRFWVRKIPVLEKSVFNANLMQELEKELPYFIALIREREIQSPKKTRAWFTTNQIHTEALDKLKKGTKLNLEKELVCVIEEKMDEFDLDEIKFSLGELQDLVKKSSYKPSLNKIKEILIEKWQLESSNTSYKSYYTILINGSDNHQVCSVLKKGRCYTFSRSFLKNC